VNWIEVAQDMFQLWHVIRTARKNVISWYPEASFIKLPTTFQERLLRTISYVTVRHSLRRWSLSLQQRAGADFTTFSTDIQFSLPLFTSPIMLTRCPRWHVLSHNVISWTDTTNPLHQHRRQIITDFRNHPNHIRYIIKILSLGNSLQRKCSGTIYNKYGRILRLGVGQSNTTSK
jgi:hypothetical protein